MEIFVAVALSILIILGFIILVTILNARKHNIDNGTTEILARLASVVTEISRFETVLKQEFVNNRVENGSNAKLGREELSKSLLSFEQKLNQFSQTIESKLKEGNDNAVNNSKASRAEVKEALATFQKDFSVSVNEFNVAQKDNFFALLGKQDEHNRTASDKMEKMRDTLEKKLSEMQAGNEKKLDEMRATVDEKLEKTLETRLGESFKLVSERLEAVHKGLGDMQQLATGVGDLKKVLTNVKTRGVMGEYQLENILEQMLTPDQYGKNVKTKTGSSFMVEFAVKLPGREEKETIVWLPIDSKFPKEDFELLHDAYEHALPETIEEYRKNFVKGIRRCALDICNKYIDPPNTTDFAILFLPFESLYAEVLRTPGLFESLQRENKIIVTGPTTLSALLSSLQMGFRTLAIEKRSSEVWRLLGAVKTEFGNFGTILDKTQRKLHEASNVIEQAGVRSRAIERKLRSVQELPVEEANGLLGDMSLLPSPDIEQE